MSLTLMIFQKGRSGTLYRPAFKSLNQTKLFKHLRPGNIYLSEDGRPEFDFRGGRWSCLIRHVQTRSGDNPAWCALNNGTVRAQAMRLDCGSDHSPTPNANFQDMWNSRSTLLTFHRTAQYQPIYHFLHSLRPLHAKALFRTSVGICQLKVSE